MRNNIQSILSSVTGDLNRVITLCIFKILPTLYNQIFYFLLSCGLLYCMFVKLPTVMTNVSNLYILYFKQILDIVLDRDVIIFFFHNDQHGSKGDTEFSINELRYYTRNVIANTHEKTVSTVINRQNVNIE